MAKPKAGAKPKAPAKAPAKPKGASLLDRIASVELPTDAYGLSRVPAGMAASDRAATLLGLGFPHVLLVTDDKLPPLSGYADYERRYLDANVVPRALLSTMYAIARAVPSDEGRDEAVAKPAAVTLEEAVAVILRGRVHLFALEGLFGSAKVAEAIVAALVASTADDLAAGTYEKHAPSVICGLGMVLWRVPAKLRQRWRADLAGLLERLREGDQMWQMGKMLDVILHGRAGVERGAYRFGNQPNGHIHFSQLMFADDDPEWLADRLAARFAVLRPADREQFDIQLAVVGGPKVLAMLRKNIGAFKKDQAKSIADQLSLVR